MKIGVLTSGGDSPGMNAAIRAVVRTAKYHNIEVLGIRRGYSGIFDDDFEILTPNSVANIIQLGGTILRTDRCLEFHEAKYRKKAYEILKKQGVECLVVIGGDGSFAGALKLSQETGMRVIGIPGTIDNDVSGTENTIGFDTAVNTAVEAIDKIRDTANSHERTFIVEVMGRHSAEIANFVALSCGAEYVVDPQESDPVENIYSCISRGIKRNKRSSIIIVAEGGEAGRTYRFAESLKTKHNIEAKVCILGHIQRGGNPTAYDRRLASVMGMVAVENAINQTKNVMIAEVCGKIVPVDIADSTKKKTTNINSLVAEQLEKLST